MFFPLKKKKSFEKKDENEKQKEKRNCVFDRSQNYFYFEIFLCGMFWKILE